MRLRNTLLLLLLAGGLFCYMRFYESQQPTTQEAEEMGTHVAQVDAELVGWLRKAYGWAAAKG